MQRLSFQDDSDFGMDLLQLPKLDLNSSPRVSMSPDSRGSKRSSQEAGIHPPSSPKFSRSPLNHVSQRLQPVWSRLPETVQQHQQRHLGPIHIGSAVYHGVHSNESPPCPAALTVTPLPLRDGEDQAADAAVAVSVAALVQEQPSQPAGKVSTAAPLNGVMHQYAAGQLEASANGVQQPHATTQPRAVVQQPGHAACAYFKDLVAKDPMMRSPWALNCNTHGEARKMISMSLKCAMEDWQRAGRQHRGSALLAAVQVDGCLFLCGTGEQLGHVLMCQNGVGMRVEHQHLLWSAVENGQAEDDVVGAFAMSSEAGTDVDVVPVVLTPADSFFVMATSSLHHKLTDQEIIGIVQGVVEDYRAPYSIGVASTAAQEIIAAAVELGLTTPAAAAVLLVPWQAS